MNTNLTYPHKSIFHFTFFLDRTMLGCGVAYGGEGMTKAPCVSEQKNVHIPNARFQMQR